MSMGSAVANPRRLAGEKMSLFAPAPLPRKFRLVNAIPASQGVAEDYVAEHRLLAETATYFADFSRGRIKIRWCQERHSFCIISIHGADLTKFRFLKNINVKPVLEEVIC